MKVNDRNSLGAAAAETTRAQDVYKPSRGDAARTGSSASGDDRVEFSSALGGLSRAISSAGSDRAARVQALATAYQNGTYKVDSATISRAMVSETLSAGTL
jgi:flagellar biosynthesis anti-sigma factor FlgM